MTLDVIGEMETMGEWALLMSLETTTAGRVFLASAPTVGSKLDQKNVPARLIGAIGYGPIEILIVFLISPMQHPRIRLPSFLILQFLKGPGNGLCNKPASFRGPISRSHLSGSSGRLMLTRTVRIAYPSCVINMENNKTHKLGNLSNS